MHSPAKKCLIMQKMHFPAETCGFQGAHCRKPQVGSGGFQSSSIKNTSVLSQEVEVKAQLAWSWASRVFLWRKLWQQPSKMYHCARNYYRTNSLRIFSTSLSDIYSPIIVTRLVAPLSMQLIQITFPQNISRYRVGELCLINSPQNFFPACPCNEKTVH